MPANNRLLSLDVLRGFTVAGMILVNNTGACGYGYAPLRHAKWDGFTPADLVFPMFMYPPTYLCANMIFNGDLLSER